MQILDLTPQITRGAAHCVVEHRMTHFDAQIYVTVRLHQIPVNFYEGFHDGQVLEWVKFVNSIPTEFKLSR